MKRLLSSLAIMGLVFFGTAGPAIAAPCPNEIVVRDVGVICVVNNGGSVGVEVRDEDGDSLVSSSVPAPAPATITVPGPVRTATLAGPTRTVTATQTQRVTATQTRTVAPPTRTATVTRQTPGPTRTATTVRTTVSTATVTRTPTNSPPRQAGVESDTVATSTTPTVTSPPSVRYVPDNPRTAAAAGSVLGLAIGVLLGIAGLFIAYKRGRDEGAEEALSGLLGPDEPQTGRHRSDE